MGQKEKLIAKLKSNPKIFAFDDAETLLGFFSYYTTSPGIPAGVRIPPVSAV